LALLQFQKLDLNSIFQEYLKKLKSTKNIPKNFKDGNLVLDPDLIDLTMIPPPATPDEVLFKRRHISRQIILNLFTFKDGVYKGFPTPSSTVSTPPTPFADRENLEAELRALEADIGAAAAFQQTKHTPAAKEGEKCVFPFLGHICSAIAFKSGLDTFHGLAAVYRDLDSFIATTTIPPPPPPDGKEPEQISAFIIPPPPKPGNNHVKLMKEVGVHKLQIVTS
jgi:hypothetical protein